MFLGTEVLVTVGRYSRQLNKLKDVLDEKKSFTGQGSRKVMLLHDNARHHDARATQQIKIMGLGVLLYVTYLPDLAPSGYHLFRSMQHALKDNHF